MLIAIIVLFSLYLTKAKKEDQTEKPIARKLGVVRKSAQPIKLKKTENSTSGKTDVPQNCSHQFGYLRTRKEKGVPEECTGCTRLVQCLLTEE